MNRTANNPINRHRHISSLGPALLVGALSLTALATPHADVQPTGVRNSAGTQRLNNEQLQQVQESLRRNSGFMELRFDQQGALTLGNRQQVQDGSATVRALLIAAVDSRNLYELESHERSPEVAFARIVESEEKMISPAGKSMSIFQVHLDFADFNRLNGAREAKASFNIGIVLLHELVHGVLKLQDPKGEPDDIGECDAHVNQMRRELGLPERLYYQPGISVTQVSSGKRIVTARLEFVERRANQQPGAKYELSWLYSQVSPNAQNLAGLQQGLLVARRR